MNQRIMLTKRLFQESLLKLLKEKSVDEITVKELCMNAGINRSTFYAHYESVRDVMVEIEKKITEEIKKIWREKNSDVRTKLTKICTHLHNEKQTELILFQNHTDSELSSVFEELNRELREIRNVDGTADDEELLASFINYGMFNLIKTWLTKDIKKKPGEIAGLLLDNILKTV